MSVAVILVFLVLALLLFAAKMLSIRSVEEFGDPDYVGCYRDTIRRALRRGPKRYGYNKERCQAACKNYNYFALQNNGWCSCENSLRHATKYGKSRRCPKTKKGGPWANDLFKNNTTPKYDPDHLGCYKDTGDRALRFGPKRYGYNKKRCRRACREYPYYALQDNGWCSCDYDLEHATQYGKSEACPRSRTGGPWANDLYQVEKDLDFNCKVDICNLD